MLNTMIGTVGKFHTVLYNTDWVGVWQTNDLNPLHKLRFADMAVIV